MTSIGIIHTSKCESHGVSHHHHKGHRRKCRDEPMSSRPGKGHASQRSRTTALHFGWHDIDPLWLNGLLVALAGIASWLSTILQANEAGICPSHAGGLRGGNV
jgi:hypothetical protein